MYVKGKGRALDIAPLTNLTGGQVHGVH